MKTIATGLIMLAILTAVPPAVFFIVALTSDMSLAESGYALLEQYQSRKQNLLVVGLINLFPLALLAIALWLYRRFGRNPVVQTALLRSGFIAIVVVSLWVNFEYWPDFLPSRVYPGFPHGLEFVIGPLFFAPAAMCACMLAAWLATRKTT